MAKLLWDKEGIGSGEVVRLCAKEFGWKKSTTYTMLRRLCEHGLFKNVNSTVTSIVSEEQYIAKVAKDLVDDKFDGSLSAFLKMVVKYRGLLAEERKELRIILSE